MLGNGRLFDSELTFVSSPQIDNGYGAYLSGSSYGQLSLAKSMGNTESEAF